jgi:chromosome segregation protein
MTKQEELEKIEKQIKEAQEKLSDIMTAINRERLVEERITKNNQKSKDDIKKIEDELEKITIKFNSESEMISKKESELDLIISGLEKEISDKNVTLNNIKKAVQIEEDNLISTKDKLFNEISSNKKIIADDEKKSKEILDGIKFEISSKSNELDKLKHEISTNEIVLDGINKKIESSKTELDILEIELESVHSIISNFGAEKEKYSEQINEMKDTIIELGEGIKSYEFELSEIKKEVNNAKSELFEIEKEKSDFIKAKFDLARQKEELQMKEEFIKDKYQQAGINY